MSDTIAGLRGRSDDELIEAHDRAAANTYVGVSYYLDELARRDSQAIARELAENTREVRAQVQRLATLTDESAERTEGLTKIILWLTAANVVAAVVAAVATIAG